MDTIEDYECSAREVRHVNSDISLSDNEYKVLRAISEASERLYGAEITRRTGIGSGPLSRILEKLEDYEWTASEKEIGDRRNLGRGLRLYHCITPDGKARLLQKERDMEEKKSRLMQKLTELDQLLTPRRPDELSA